MTARYEHRLNPDDLTRIEVRRLTARPLKPRGRDQRPWKLYMQTNSEAEARRILSMLCRHEPETVVYP